MITPMVARQVRKPSDRDAKRRKAFHRWAVLLAVSAALVVSYEKRPEKALVE